jgi:hypothetical protein
MTLLALHAACVLADEPATGGYAGAQLGFAEEELARAHAAYASNDFTTGSRLASQAALDARLAWSMSDSAILRRAAVDVFGRAERLRARSIIAGGASGAAEH